MKIDPREENLPKWAQELLQAERLKNALRFPDQPPPEPDFTADASGHSPDGKPLSSAVGSRVYSENSRGTLANEIGKAGYLYPVGKVGEGSGFRGRGNYYLRIEDARLARAWRIARRAAGELLANSTMEPRR